MVVLTPVRPSVRTWLREIAAPTAVGLIASLILFRHGIAHLRSNVFGVPGDSELFVWSFRWVPWAISHGDWPLTTHAVFSTTGGLNLAHNTFAPLGAVVLWPITSLFGPVLSYNLYTLSAPVLSVLAAYFVLRPHVRRSSACIGGLMFAFSPLAYLSTEGHPQVTQIWAAVIGLALLSRALFNEDPTARRRQSVIGGFLVALQLYMGIEMLALAALMVIVGAVTLLGLDADYRAALWARRRAALGSWWPAAVTFALVGGPFLATWLFGPERFFGVHQGQDATAADLAGFVVPSNQTFFNGPTLVSQPKVVPFRSIERGAYLGVVLIAVLLYITIRKWGELTRFFRFATVSLWAGSILSLGSELQIWGKNTHIILPWAILAKTPILSSALTERLAVFTMLGAGALIAWMFDRWRSDQVPAVWKGLAVIGVIMLAPGDLPTAFPVPTAHQADAITSFCGPHAQVLTVPREYQHHAMLLQAQADNSFDLVRAFGFRAGTSEQFGPLLAVDLESHVEPNAAGIAEADQQLRRLGTTCVVALDARNAVWTAPPDLVRLAKFFGRPCTPIYDQCGWKLTDGG
jgi:hypothetical protein